MDELVNGTYCAILSNSKVPIVIAQKLSKENFRKALFDLLHLMPFLRSMSTYGWKDQCK